MNNKKNTKSKKNASQVSTNNSNTRSNNKNHHKHKNTLGHRISLSLKFIILFILIAIIAVILYFYFKYGKTILQMQSEANRLVKASSHETFKSSQTSLVYDINGTLISSIKSEKDMYYIEYEDIPSAAIGAIVATEDRKFLHHDGVDYLANIRAVIALIKNKGEITQGASTITQQLSRNIFLSHEVTYERKIKEIFIAQALERKYSKSDIMEFYLNNIYFANGHYGLMAAANGYFSQGVGDLSLSQIVFLCAIPNNPNLYNPITNYKNTLSRRNRILKIMLESGEITQDEYDEAIAEEIVLKVQKPEKKNYVETYVNYSTIRTLMKVEGFQFRSDFVDKEDKEKYEKEYQELYSSIQQKLYVSGYRIYTSIDLEKQKILQESVDEVLSNFTETSDEGIYQLQGAAVSIDNYTGRVVAIVGGRSQEQSGYTLNRAFQSYRQPGSSIKPLIVYAPAFEMGYYPNSKVIDEKFEGGPKNSGNTYSGKITLQKAIESSKNTIAWKLFTEITPNKGLQYLLNMNFQKIDERDYYPASSLGGFTYGTSPVEMAAAYATLENDGFYREPTCIIRIVDADGTEIVKEEEIPEVQIYEPTAAKITTEALTGVIKNGTGRGLGLSNTISAGKTGTTSDQKDGWFVGYTPYYTTSVWVGYDIPKTLSSLTGSSYPGSIWHKYMEAIHHKGMKDTFQLYDWRGVLEEEERLRQEEEERQRQEELEQEELEEEEVVEDPVIEDDPDLEDPIDDEEQEEEEPWVDDETEEDFEDDSDLEPEEIDLDDDSEDFGEGDISEDPETEEIE